MIQLQINKKYQGVVPPLKEDEYNELKESIKRDGLWHPITINSDGVVLDGHNRFRVCNELNIKPRTNTKTFENKLYEEKFVIESNLKRRQLNDFQKAELSIPLIKIENKLAKLRHNQLASNEANSPKGKAIEIVSKKIGLSRGILERAKKVIELAPEETKQKLRDGTKSITSAYNEIKNESKVEKQESMPLPKGKYQIIYADPPWSYGNFHKSYDTGKTAAEIYDVMDQDALKNLEISKLSHDDSVLLMWVTYPCLEQGIKLIKEWGFTYKTVAFTWVKKNKNGEGYFYGLGNYTRANAEICLLAIKGKGLTVKSHNVRQICDAPLTVHSEKPAEIRDRIVNLFGDVTRIELFARKKVDGWESWGNEL